MGNDDNTPLTGVTGGGLPADIWRETMLRVHDGLPARALPMTAPDRPKPADTPQQPAPQQPRRTAPLDDAIRGILGTIFGGN